MITRSANQLNAQYARVGRIARAEMPIMRYLGLITLAMGTRVAVSSGNPASSLLGAAIFAAMLGAIAMSSTRANAPRMRGIKHVVTSVIAGLIGAAVLIFFAYRAVGFATFPVHPSAQLVIWSGLVSAVAITEEIVFRGVLFNAINRRHGVYAAGITCALAFAVIHVPLYGWGAFPLDVAVGIWLAAVRMWGGVSAAAISHTTADLATGWFVI